MHVGVVRGFAFLLTIAWAGAAAAASFTVTLNNSEVSAFAQAFIPVFDPQDGSTMDIPFSGPNETETATGLGPFNAAVQSLFLVDQAFRNANPNASVSLGNFLDARASLSSSFAATKIQAAGLASIDRDGPTLDPSFGTGAASEFNIAFTLDEAARVSLFGVGQAILFGNGVNVETGPPGGGPFSLAVNLEPGTYGLFARAEVFGSDLFLGESEFSYLIAMQIPEPPPTTLAVAGLLVLAGAAFRRPRAR